MEILSLFDGISCGQLALQRAGFAPRRYFASEVDESAIAITRKNYPNTIHLGDVRQVRTMAQLGLLPRVELLMGGSPCQGFSRAGKERGIADVRSQLIFDFINIKDTLKPRYFLLENVKMNKTDLDMISTLIGCEPIEINSALLSAQKRNRLYWTNIPFAPIISNNTLFWTIREYAGEHLEKYKCNRTASRIRMWADGNGRGNEYGCVNVTFADKTNCLTIKQDRFSNAGLIQYQDFCRYLTHVECERLQTLPDNYTSGAGWNARYKHLGNGWTVDVIAHILRGMRI